LTRNQVLQEVAAARHLSIACGDVEISGNVFCQGLPQMALKGSLLNLATSVIQMMKWNAPNLSLHKQHEKHDPQLGVAPLGELLEKFHLHKASDRRDKIFALIGACRDSNEEGNLLIPDYTKRFSTVLREVVTYLLGPSVHTTTWDHRELSIITGRGCPLGTVSSRLQDGTSTFFVEFAHFLGARKRRSGYGARLRQETYCKEIRDGDMLWQMTGAQYPSIIRPCKEHFDAIVITLRIDFVVDLGSIGCSSPPIRWHEFRRYLPAVDVPITLVWDWLPITEQTCEEHESIFLADWNRVPHSDLILNSARIFDVSHNHSGLTALSGSLLEVASRESKTSNHARLLALACEYWESYTWLKTYIGEIRLGLRLLKRGGPWQLSKPSDIFERWQSEGCVTPDVLDIDAMFRASANVSRCTTSTRYHDTVVSEEFGEPEHREDLAKLFSGQVDLSKPATNIGIVSKRNILRIVFAHENRASSKASSPSVADILELIHGLPPRIGCIMLVLASEYHGNNLHISPSTTLTRYCPGYPCFPAFLLAESFADVNSMYNIIGAVIHRERRPWDSTSCPCRAVHLQQDR
jgi:hypothetical protein